MKTVLFTGVTGLLGKYFFKSPQAFYKLIGTYNKNPTIKKKNFYALDISNKEEVRELFKKINPDFVVHAASLGNVDYCQTHKKEAHMVNVIGTRNVISACKKVNAKIIFTSSNAVYDGKNSPYSENSPKNPLDYYGKTKVEGEDIVRSNNVPYVILRLMTMYGWPNEGGRNNPVAWIIDELKNKRQLNVVNDIYNNHLYAGQAAEVIWKLIKYNKKNEVYNVSGADCISRHELALKVAEVFGLNKNFIKPVNSDFFKNIAKRPKNTCFNTVKIESDLGIKPLSITAGLKLMKNERP